jgi:hypothetical protein
LQRAIGGVAGHHLFQFAGVQRRSVDPADTWSTGAAMDGRDKPGHDKL